MGWIERNRYDSVPFLERYGCVCPYGCFVVDCDFVRNSEMFLSVSVLEYCVGMVRYNFYRYVFSFHIQCVGWPIAAETIGDKLGYTSDVCLYHMDASVRAGSNLDPAEANEAAWTTVKDMVGQIGSSWNLSLIPSMAWSYRNVFLLIVLGMVIHWLPDSFKRRYRIWFASTPLVSMGLLA